MTLSETTTAHLGSSFNLESELVEHRKVLTNVLRLSDNKTNEWIEKLKDEYDEPLKALLFAQCPNLAHLSFEVLTWWNSLGRLSQYPLTLLCDSIRGLKFSRCPF